MRIDRRGNSPGPRADFDPFAPSGGQVPSGPPPAPPGGQFPPPQEPFGQPFPQAPPGRSPLKIALIAGCGCLTLLGIAVAGFFIWAMSLPDYGAISGDKITPKTMEYLRAHDLISDNEKIIYFYDNTIYLTNEELCFFTDRKIVSYEEGKTNDQVKWEDVEDITSGKDFLSFIVMVKARGHRFVKCEITEGSNENEFYQALLDTWDEKKAQ